MATKTITQLHGVVVRKKTDTGFDVVTLGPDDLGQDDMLTYNVAPRKSTRSSSAGTTEKPIAGTFDSLSASLTILNVYWETIGKILGTWNAATYEDADGHAGNNIYGDGAYDCGDDVPVSVIVYGVCDDGSTADVEFTRCYPSVDDDKTVGSGDLAEITVNLNPQIYNAATMSADGYPQYTVREGDNSLTENQRINASTGVYAAVTSGD